MNDRTETRVNFSNKSNESRINNVVSDMLEDQEGWICGVCAGIANKLNIDAAIVRIGVIVLALIVPVMTIAAYLIAWLLFFRGRRD